MKAISLTLHEGNELGHATHNVTKSQREMDQTLAEIIATCLVTCSRLPATNRPGPPKKVSDNPPNVEGKKASTAAGVVQKWKNKQASYPAKMAKYEAFMPVLAKFEKKAAEYIHIIATRLLSAILTHRTKQFPDWKPMSLEWKTYNHYLRNFNQQRDKCKNGVVATWKCKLQAKGNQTRLFFHQYKIYNVFVANCYPKFSSITRVVDFTLDRSHELSNSPNCVQEVIGLITAGNEVL